MHSYQGNQPFLFLSYSHRNRTQVFEIAEKLSAEGYRVWCDKSIEAGTDFDNVIASHIRACDVFIMFLSKTYLKSDYCDIEFKYANNNHKKCIAIYLEPCDLYTHPGMEMFLIHSHIIYKYQMEQQTFYQNLLKTSLIVDCKMDEDEAHQIQVQEKLRPAPKGFCILSVFFSLITIITIFLQCLFIRTNESSISLFEIPISHIAINYIYISMIVGQALILYQQEKRYAYITDQNSTLSLYAAYNISLNGGFLSCPALPNHSVHFQVIIGFLAIFLVCLLLTPALNKKTIPIVVFGYLNTVFGYDIAVFITVLLYGDSFRWTAFITLLWSLILVGTTLIEPPIVSKKIKFLIQCDCIIYFCCTGLLILFLLISPLYQLLLRFSDKLFSLMEIYLINLPYISISSHL